MPTRKAALVAIVAALGAMAVLVPRASRAEEAPRYVVEPFWPKSLPADWILGQVSGIAVDGKDHIWVLHRPATLVDDEKGAMQTPPATKCCAPAPAVLEFDGEGTLLRSWVAGAWRASSSGSTTSPSTARAISTPPKSVSAAGPRNSGGLSNQECA